MDGGTVAIYRHRPTQWIPAFAGMTAWVRDAAPYSAGAFSACTSQSWNSLTGRCCNMRGRQTNQWL